MRRLLAALALACGAAPVFAVDRTPSPDGAAVYMITQADS